MPAQRPSVERGAPLYAEKCAGCHGVGGAGDGASAAGIRAQGKTVPSLIDPALLRNASPAAWHAVVSNGRIANLMPPFAQSLSEQQRWDVLAYVYALGQPADALITGRQVFENDCARCHASTVFAAPQGFASRSLAAIEGALARLPQHANLNLTPAQAATMANVVRAQGYEYADPARIRVRGFEGDGLLAYQTENRNRNGAPINANVTLRAYDAQREVFSRTVQTDAAGRATFDSLPRNRGYFYEPEVTYSGARFFAAPTQLTTTAQMIRPLSVWETTSDPAAVRIAEWHFFVQEVRDNDLTIAEILVFDNRSDRAFASAPGRSIRFSAPTGARNLRFDGPGLETRFAREGDTLIDLDAFMPGAGTASVTMIYELDHAGRSRISRQAYYPVAMWDAVLPDVGMRVEGLQDRGIQPLANATVQLYTGQPLPAPGQLAFEIVGSARGRPAGDDTRALVLAVAVALLATIVAGFLIMRARLLQQAA